MKYITYFTFDLGVSRSLREKIVGSLGAWKFDYHWAIPDVEFTLFVIKYGEHIHNISVFDRPLDMSDYK